MGFQLGDVSFMSPMPVVIAIPNSPNIILACRGKK